MTPSKACVDLIKQFEGFEPKAYRCPAGKLTIGYGHVVAPTEYNLRDAALTEDQATRLLEADLGRFAPQVTAMLSGLTVRQHQFDALVSFAYNCGAGALRGSTLLRKLRAGDVAGAAEEFLRWNKAGGRELAGLTRRRNAERALFIG
ncbi:lysozyme [Crenobacter caeni]|uniref:Lysozyme n=1 Tax=Crenobacter caeni TaxID=2705474 RepID=A0A6B2KNN0_9NEIS|nr:lysozyme [Crenobacter caeni]NDV11691.1 lysozyme [Crenobacter caeni]